MQHLHNKFGYSNKCCLGDVSERVDLGEAVPATDTVTLQSLMAMLLCPQQEAVNAMYQHNKSEFSRCDCLMYK